MLKLPKGLKKKKKGKKSKKDQELYTEEELKQYKREQQLQQQQQQKQNEESDAASDTEIKPRASEPKSEEDDEWSKFKALTAGVDSIVHKTQEDLDRIKSTSFFKRVPPPSEKKKLEAEEAAVRESERLEQERLKKEEEEANRDKLAEAVVELSESEEESEEADDIFDTGYIDAITSGEVQLTIVPDSPDLQVEEGPDPFDTSYAEKLIKGPEVSKRGKKIVSLGSAVEVLTGRIDSAQAVSASGAKRKPRRGPQDLLLDNFDDEDLPAPENESSVTPEPAKTLLDDPADELPDVPIDLSVSLHLALQKDLPKPVVDVENGKDSNNIISEFDVLVENEEDEFAELAAESLIKKEEVLVLTQAQPIEFSGEVDTDWAQFERDQTDQRATKEEEKSQGKPPRPPLPAVVGTVEPESDDEFAVLDDDPFDTTFAEKVLPEDQQADDDFDFDPRAEEKTAKVTVEPEKFVERDLLGGSNPDLTKVNPSVNLLTVVQKDLLGGSVTDLSAFGQAPIAPVQDGESSVEDFDPFDTTAITTIVQPKEAELKVIEKELLAESTLKHSLSDPDFDPRAEEPEEPIAATVHVYAPQVEFDPARRKSSLSLNLQSKSVAFLVPSNDLLSTEHEGSKVQKPLTPYYPQKETILEKEVEDPFDTSFVPETKPTKVELNILEQDLLTSSTLKHSLSDSDFDPRAEETGNVEVTDIPKSDLLIVEDQIDIKVLTPAQEVKAVEQPTRFVDPFDTSIAANIFPGKTELKLIESELLPASTSTVLEGVLDTLSDAQELGLGDKVLTPQVPAALQESLEEVDPFDTSFAANLGPGKTEIRILETELIEK